jgi:hypothetical protein
MPRILLTLVACLLALGPSRACACAAAPCPDAGCPRADAQSGCGHHHHHAGDETEPVQPDGHKHHDQDCPAVAAVTIPALPAPDSATVDAPDVLNCDSFAHVPTDSAIKVTRSQILCPPAPHVPLHVSLQVFRN